MALRQVQSHMVALMRMILALLPYVFTRAVTRVAILTVPADHNIIANTNIEQRFRLLSAQQGARSARFWR